MFAFVILLAAASLVLGATKINYGVPLLDGRIVGGEPALIENYPYQVLLMYKGRHRCGGSIISNKFVVTAAHCTVGLPTSEFAIRANSTFVNEGGVVVNVTKINEHPKYSKNGFDYDVAVLQLASELKFGKGIAYISLPYQNQNISAGTQTNVTGWGALKEGGASPRQLQVVKVPIVDHKKCQDAYGSSIKVTDRMICAGIPEGGKDACQGDSGGPLVNNGTLFGIVSWGRGCARPKYPGVYTNVPAVRDYIKQVSGV